MNYFYKIQYVEQMDGKGGHFYGALLRHYGDDIQHI